MPDGQQTLGQHRADRDPGGDGTLLPRLRDVGHRVARAARRARRAEAGAPPDPLRDVRARPAPRPPAHEVLARRSVTSWATTTRTATSAIYDALARMAQDFSLRHPLIDGHGTFGSPDPERPPAAPRYTECRLAPIAMQLLDGIDEDTVDFADSYDGKTHEPTVLPARFPNLLVNGGQGIAVGMATNIPPHNLGEVIDATDAPHRQPRRHARRPHAVRAGPRLPDRRADPRPAAASIDAYRTGARLDQACARSPRSRRAGAATAHRRHRDPVPDLGRGHRREDRRPRERPRASRASAASATSRRRARRSSSSS